MKLSSIAAALGCTLPGASDPEITLVTQRSDRVIPGALYAAIRGDRFDGRDFINEAKLRGAAAIITEAHDEHRLPSLIVPNARRALALACAAFYDHPANRLKLAAVTGTNGKTSTVYMLKAIFEHCGMTAAAITTVTGELTTPIPEELHMLLARFLREGAGYVFMEASSQALDRERLYGLHFDAAVFTNLTPEHLDYHKTLEGYAAAKAKLFGMCDRAIINAASPYAPLMAERSAAQPIYYSSEPDDGINSDFWADNISLNESGSRCLLHSPQGTLTLHLNIHGRFSISNALAAVACAYSLGIPAEGSVAGLGELESVPGRFERIALPDADFSVYIDYAHTPDALRSALESARELKPSRLTVLFGCGGDRDRTKRPIMGSIASALADFTIITSDNSRSEEPYAIISEILSGVDLEAPHIAITDRRKAIEYALSSASPGELILLCGKGHEQYELTRCEKKEFDERKIVSECFSELHR